MTDFIIPYRLHQKTFEEEEEDIVRLFFAPLLSFSLCPILFVSFFLGAFIKNFHQLSLVYFDVSFPIFHFSEGFHLK